MQRLRVFLAGFVSAAAVSMVPMVLAQQSGLINVDISNVANNIAKNINVDVSQIPVTVQVPVGVAANVCGVAANVLGQQAPSGNASCDATSTSTALDQVVHGLHPGDGRAARRVERGAVGDLGTTVPEISRQTELVFEREHATAGEPA